RTAPWDTVHHGNFCAVGYHNPKREKVSGPMGSNPHGLERPHSVNAVSRSLKQMAKELGSEYKTRRSDGVITNIVLTDEVEEFMPKPVMFTP
ncbi:hypothetical protein, partial [Aeromonas caviae]|uniref:hypothetical protein n=1 Tax=Aeromonas caviae TaxID=648 RepID=UPI0030149D66